MLNSKKKEQNTIYLDVELSSSPVPSLGVVTGILKCKKIPNSIVRSKSKPVGNRSVLFSFFSKSAFGSE
jgi:hypothetical protein